MNVLDWLLDSDPAIRWQVLRDLVHAPAEVVAAERARVATEGWGARLLALQGEDGQWAGGACFPARSFSQSGENQVQPWISTLPTLQLLHDFGVDPCSDRVRRAVALVRDHCRWEKLESKNHGSYQFETTDPRGNKHGFNGVIHEFSPNRKITRTFEMENATFPVQLEFLEFEKLTDDTSKLDMHIVFRSVAHRDQMLQLPFAQGINMAHNRLQDIVSKLK